MPPEILEIKSFYLLYEIPQMAPMNWLFLYGFFTLVWLSLGTRTYFN